MLADLEKIRENSPKDMARYEFALTQAIETTNDSLELSKQDLGKRTADVEAKDAREKKDLESMSKSEEAKEKEKAGGEKKAAEAPPGDGARFRRCAGRARSLRSSKGGCNGTGRRNRLPHQSTSQVS